MTYSVGREPDFDALRSLVSRSVDTDIWFPQWPFRAERSYAVIYELPLILSAGIGETLRALAEFYGDETVIGIVLSPDPTSFLAEYSAIPVPSYAG